jgi:hypothetical protein
MPEKKNIFQKMNREDFKEMMAFMTIAGTFVYMYLVTFIPIPESSQRFADIILGSLLTLVLGKVLGEYFDAKPKTERKDDDNEEGSDLP